MRPATITQATLVSLDRERDAPTATSRDVPMLRYRSLPVGAASISRPFQWATPVRSWHARAASSYSDARIYAWIRHARKVHRARGDLAELEARPRTADHRDLVLARAVRAHVISKDEAELIAVSRIEGVSLPELARRLGISHAAIRWRRCRAEARRVAYLERGIRSCHVFAEIADWVGAGHPGAGRHGRVASATADNPAPRLSPKGGEQAPQRPASTAPGARTSTTAMRRSEPCDIAAEAWRHC
jgi:hypothetical protein